MALERMSDSNGEEVGPVVFCGMFVSSEFPNWKKHIGMKEDTGVFRATPQQVHVEGRRNRLFKNVSHVRFERPAFPWIFLVFFIALPFGMFYAGLLRSLTPQDPLFRLSILLLIVLLLINWRRTRTMTFDYAVEDGSTGSASVTLLDVNQRSFHPSPDQLFQEVFRVVLQRIPTDEEASLQ